MIYLRIHIILAFAYFCYFEIVIKSNYANRETGEPIESQMFVRFYVWNTTDGFIHIHMYLVVDMRLSLFYFDSMSDCLHARDNLRSSDLLCTEFALSHVAPLVCIFFLSLRFQFKIEWINRRLCVASIDSTDMKVMDVYLISHFFCRCSLFSLILYTFDMRVGVSV